MGRETSVPIGNVSFGIEEQEPAGPRPVWENRIIDIDILFYEDWVLNDPLLTIPHPRLTERDFVMKGVLELSPRLVHPVLKKPLKELVAQA